MTFLSKHGLKILSLTLALLLAGLAYGYGKNSSRNANDRSVEQITRLKEDLGLAATSITRSQDLLKEALSERTNLEQKVTELEQELVSVGHAVLTHDSSGGGKLTPVRTRVVRVPRECPIREASLDPDFEGLPGDDPPHRGEPEVAELAPGVDCGWGYSDFRITALTNICSESFQYHLSQTFELDIVETEQSDGNIDTSIELREVHPDSGATVETLHVQDFTVLRKRNELQKRFTLWSPHVDLGLSLFTPTINPTSTSWAFSSIGFTVGGYGTTNLDQDWRFLRGSVNFGESTRFSISPIGFNLGKLDIPLISVLGVYPEVSPGELWGIGISLTTTL